MNMIKQNRSLRIYKNPTGRVYKVLLKKPGIKINTSFVGFLLCLSCLLQAQAPSADQCTSPYFIVLIEGDVEAMPLKSTDVKVDISGSNANVHVKQVYKNTCEHTIEAVYVFPASTRAAVYKVEMKVGERIVNAVIKEKGQARKMYHEANKKGKVASLLEEERPNVFKMKVANIIPGAQVEVDMYYTELLVPTDKVYEFVYPTVVGPRYISSEEQQSGRSENWVSNPYLKTETINPTKLFIDVNLNSGIPIKDIKCETHQSKIAYSGKQSAQISMQEPAGGNRDFVLQYSLAGESIEAGVLVYEEPNGESYFLAMMEPPRRNEKADVVAREYIFVVDVSGSMIGYPLDVSKAVMKRLMEGLNEQDLFNIVFLAGGSQLYAKESLAASQINVANALAYLDNINGNGGTELLDALKVSMNLKAESEHSRSFVIMTDGYVTVEAETFDYIRNNLGKANFFAFGIGQSVNRHLIEGMAHVGCGEPFIVLDKNDAAEVSNRFINYVSYPVLTNITYDFDAFEAYDVLPAKVPDLFAERPIMVCGKFRGATKGSIDINGLAAGKPFKTTLAINKASKNNQALKYLWAREKVRLLADYNQVDYNELLKQEIIDLGLKYNLLTQYTSFIAVDDEVVTSADGAITVKHAVPLPKHVSSLAVANIISIEDDCELDEDLEIEFCYEEEVEEEGVFYTIETMAEFPGGEKALAAYLTEGMQYPPEAIESGISGTVYISFVIDTDGSVSEVKVVRGLTKEINAEAIRLVKAMPKWTPAKQRNKAVKMSYTIPIRFSLE